MPRITLEAFVAELTPEQLEDAIVRAAHATIHDSDSYPMTPYHIKQDGYGRYHVTFFKKEEKA